MYICTTAFTVYSFETFKGPIIAPEAYATCNHYKLGYNGPHCRQTLSPCSKESTLPNTI